jgi:acetyl esterase/lipase
VDEFRVIWLTEAEQRRPQDPVVIFCHGGAYVFGLLPGFPDLWRVAYQRLKNRRLSIILLDYSLGPEAKFPRPLEEMVLLYNELSKSCDNIILSGDSAGGHLVLSILRHRKYPMYDVPLVEGPEPSGALLMSPWVNIYPTDVGSYVKNKHKDILSTKFLRGCTELFLDSPDKYRCPQLNPYKDFTDWVKILPGNILVTLGDSEIQYDDIISWAKMAHLNPGQLYIETDAIHDTGFLLPAYSPITDRVVQYLRDSRI